MENNYPAYRSRLGVRAFLIGRIFQGVLIPDDVLLDPIAVTTRWIKKHKAQVGGYYVVDYMGNAHWQSARDFVAAFRADEDKEQAR